MKAPNRRVLLRAPLVSAQIKAVMHAASLKQVELAVAIGVPLDRIKSLSSGKAKKLTPAEIRALVVRVNVRPEFLTTGDGDVLKKPKKKLALPSSYEALVHEIVVGTALRDVAGIRTAIDRFVSAEVERRRRK